MRYDVEINVDYTGWHPGAFNATLPTETEIGDWSATIRSGLMDKVGRQVKWRSPTAMTTGPARAMSVRPTAKPANSGAQETSQYGPTRPKVKRFEPGSAQNAKPRSPRSPRPKRNALAYLINRDTLPATTSLPRSAHPTTGRALLPFPEVASR